jgi:hypothetical protein
MILLFHEDIASERELMARLAERLDYLWFLGFSLDTPIPDHSVLSKARKRWGAELFQQLFVRSVRQCVDAGLVDGCKLHMDSSLVDANASKDSIVEGPVELITALKHACGAMEAKLDEGITTPESYEAVSEKTCMGCVLRERCTRSRTGRTVHRHEHQELLDRAREQAHGDRARADRRRRQYLLEGSFAEAANNHGFKRARWRRLWRQQIQHCLIAAVQNWRIMLREREPATKVLPNLVMVQPAGPEARELWARKSRCARTHRNGTPPYAESWREVLNAGSPGVRGSIWVGSE